MRLLADLIERWNEVQAERQANGLPFQTFKEWKHWHDIAEAFFLTAE